MERPPAPPEAVLIRIAREAAGIPVAVAAKNAGVSVARWSQIESGSEMRHGSVNPVTGRAGTIARMAAEVGLTPERMASEGRRPDAAEILSEILRQEVRHLPRHVPPRPAPALEFDESDLPDDEFTPAEQRTLQDLTDEFRLRYARARRRHPGERLTGALVFPADPVYREMWDLLDSLGWKTETLPRALAAALVMRDESGSGSESGTATGLGVPALRALR